MLDKINSTMSKKVDVKKEHYQIFFILRLRKSYTSKNQMFDSNAPTIAFIYSICERIEMKKEENQF